MTEIAKNTLEVGTSGKGEVVINHSDLELDKNGVGHIVLSPQQATDLALLLLAKAAAVKAEKDYVVLSPAERSKGFVRPYRDSYIHLTCGKITTMKRAIAETYARVPQFYGGTFCSTCSGHFPIGEEGEFVWYEFDGTTGPKVGT